MIFRSIRPIQQPATPLREIEPGLLIKFECDNPGGSHKVRAARHIVRSALAAGDIEPGATTVIEKTGGNFGFGLAIACHEYNVPVELAVGLGFSAVKRRCLQTFGAKLIGIDMLERGATPREVVEWHLDQATETGQKYFYTDQFHNTGSLAAHEYDTGPEIALQLREWLAVRKLTFIGCAGTGASLTGIARALKAAGYAVDVILVEPAGCDSRKGVFTAHRFKGMSVGVAPPLLDWTLVTDVRYVTHEAAIETRNTYSRQTGYLVGNTSAACLTVARALAVDTSADHKILTILYDHGHWYIQ